MYPNGRRRSLRGFLKAELREDLLLEVELLILAFATGIGDAATYSEYRVFTANHTGNTILIAVGTMEMRTDFQPLNRIPIPLNLIAFSLGMFLLGGWITGQIGNRIGRRQRWWIQLSNFFQMFLILIASLLQASRIGWNYKPQPDQQLDTGGVSMGIITLLALSAGGQVAMVRSLQMTEITTANATSCYVDLLIDERLFERPNRGRNRRLSFLACLSIGSFAGSFAYRELGSPKTLFLSMMGKVLVSIMLLFNKEGLWAKGGFHKERDTIKSEMCSDSDLSFSSHPEKECTKCVDLQVTSNLSEKPKYDEFDYRGTEIRASRDSSHRYTTGTYLDLTNSQLYVQIPSWTITATTYVPRHAPGI